MKKLLLVLFISAALPSFGQSWAAPGATWYYDFTNYAMPFPQYGYERIQKTGDTIINGRQYDKLQIYRTWYNQQTQQAASYYVPQLEFTRADSGVVYYYRDSADYILYNFNAQPGETWVLRNEFEGTMCDTASVVVDSISTMIINGDTLRKLWTNPVNWAGITFQYPPLVEKIGGLANLLPYTMCVTDIPQGYNLRCYSDSAGWTYQNPNWTYACDYMLGIDIDHGNTIPFTVFHDANAHTLTLTGANIVNGTSIQVFDTRGQLVLQQVLHSNGSAVLDFPQVATGIYFVTVISNGIQGSMPFLVTE